MALIEAIYAKLSIELMEQQEVKWTHVEMTVKERIQYVVNKKNKKPVASTTNNHTRNPHLAVLLCVIP